MSDNIQAQAEQERPPVADPLEDMAGIPNGAEELRAYEAEIEAAMMSQPEPEPEQSAQEEPAQEVAEESDEATQSEGEEPVPAEEPEPKTPDRFRFKSKEDQAVAMLARAKEISLVEAARIYAGETAAKQPEEPAREESGEPAETVKSLSERIKTLSAEKAAALNELENERAAEIDILIDELRDKREELRFAEASAKVENERKQAEAFERAYVASEEKTVAFYPDAAAPNSALTKKMTELDQQMRDLGDPIYHSPDKPFILAKAAAKELGIPMTKPGAAKPAPAPKAPMQPAPGNRGTTQAAVSAAKLDQIDGLGTIEDYEKFVGAL